MSGGPIYNSAGNVCGINSAGATHFFNTPSSIGSSLHMLILTELEVGMDIGPVRINRKARLLDLIMEGVLVTDGSEAGLGFSLDEITGKTAIHSRLKAQDVDYVFDDFASLQDGIPPSKLGATEEIWRVRKS